MATKLTVNLTRLCDMNVSFNSFNILKLQTYLVMFIIQKKNFGKNHHNHKRVQS